MNKELKKILDDLYELDAGFKDYEKDLIKILEKLMASKPDIKVDKQFLNNLRRQLMAKAEEMSEASPDLSTNFFAMLKRWIAPFAGGVVVTALILIAVLYNNPYFNPSKLSLDSESESLTTATSATTASEATKLKDDAWDLSELSVGGGEASGSVAYGRGGGGVSATSAVSAPMAATATAESAVGAGGGGVAVSSDMAVSSKAIAVPAEQYYYKYVYKGDTLELTDSKVTVFRRKTMKVDDSSITRSLKSFGFGTIDLSGFSDATAVNLSLAQEKKYGYEISIDFINQAVNMYQNWGQWDSPYDKCKGEQKCYDDLRLKIEDVPSDSELQKTADSFLKQHGVDLTLYGAPEIQKYWLNYPEYESGASSEIYIPEQIQLIYPLLVDGKTVMDEYGNPNGMYVSVDIRSKKVSSVNNLRPDSYESSDYDAETDINKLMEYANSYNWQYSEEAKAVEVELGDPKEVMVILYRQSTETKKRPDEYYVPALQFPVVNKPDKYFYRKYVVVPLAKDLLKREDSGYPVPVPLMRAEPAVDN